MNAAALPYRAFAPAKLNLFLHVVGRREDGHHELQTAFQLINLCDELSFELSDDSAIVRSAGPPGVPAESDLTVRAAQALRAAAKGARRGVRIGIRKRIPMGAGLGGGSSDAATTLRVLNHLWKIGFDSTKLAEIAVRIGADVPFFLMSQNAWGEGIGDRLSPLKLPKRWFLLLHPGVAVPTAEVFQAPELTRNSPLLTIAGFFESGGRNDCEPVVRRRYPAVAAALDWLSRSAPARLTGTGSCVFASFDSAAAAERVAARVPDQDGWRAWVVESLERAPPDAS